MYKSHILIGLPYLDAKVKDIRFREDLIKMVAAGGEKETVELLQKLYELFNANMYTSFLNLL